jgi:hypothetical protein
MQRRAAARARPVGSPPRDAVVRPSLPGQAPPGRPSFYARRFAAKTFTPATPNLRATFSFEVPRNGSNRSRISTPSNPTSASSHRSSASGRAPPIQPVHRSMSWRIDSGSSDPTTMSA